MRHLNDWDQHFIQIRSEAKLKATTDDFATESDHTGEVVSTPSWFDKLLAIGEEPKQTKAPVTPKKSIH